MLFSSRSTHAFRHLHPSSTTNHIYRRAPRLLVRNSPTPKSRTNDQLAFVVLRFWLIPKRRINLHSRGSAIIKKARPTKASGGPPCSLPSLASSPEPASSLAGARLSLSGTALRCLRSLFLSRRICLPHMALPHQALVPVPPSRRRTLCAKHCLSPISPSLLLAAVLG